MISLLTFIQTERLGEIGLGSTREEVEAAFGVPTQWDGHHDRKRATLWKYSDFNVHIFNNVVSIIHVYNFETANITAIPFNSVGISRQMDEDEVELWLYEYDIAFTKRRGHWCESGIVFQTNSGVELELCADEIDNRGKPARLCSISARGR